MSFKSGFERNESRSLTEQVHGSQFPVRRAAVQDDRLPCDVINYCGLSCTVGKLSVYMIKLYLKTYKETDGKKSNGYMNFHLKDDSGMHSLLRRTDETERARLYYLP